MSSKSISLPDVFAPMWEGTRYLSLLHISGPEALPAVKLVKDCCARSADPVADVSQLLRDANWRPHLVGAVAIATVPDCAEALSDLWAAIDAGSWVTPQLAVVAFLRDPLFAERALERLQVGCPVDTRRIAGLSAPERHIASGPAGATQRSAKTAASLIHLARGLDYPPQWALNGRDYATFVELAAKDIDNSARIAHHWRDNLLKVLARLSDAQP